MEPNNTDYTGVDPHTKMNKILESLYETLIAAMGKVSNGSLDAFVRVVLPIVEDRELEIQQLADNIYRAALQRNLSKV